jgi:hypothetical protein
MIYIPSFIKFGLGVEKLLGGTHIHRPVPPFFENMKSRLKEQK